MRNLLLLILLVFGSAAHATLNAFGEVTILEMWEGHSGPLVELSNMSTTAGECPRNDLYILVPGHAHFEEIFSMLLSARVAGSNVRLYFLPGVCVEGFPRISHIKL